MRNPTAIAQCDFSARRLSQLRAEKEQRARDERELEQYRRLYGPIGGGRGGRGRNGNDQGSQMMDIDSQG